MAKLDNNDSYDVAKKEIIKAWSLLRKTCIELGTLSPNSKDCLKEQGEKARGRKNGNIHR